MKVAIIHESSKDTDFGAAKEWILKLRPDLQPFSIQGRSRGQLLSKLVSLHEANRERCVGSLTLVDADDIDAVAARRKLTMELDRHGAPVLAPNDRALDPERPIIFKDKKLQALSLVTPVATLEAWLLADQDAVRKFVAPKDPKSVKFPAGNPEKLPSPKKALEKIIKAQRGDKSAYRPKDAQGIAGLSDPTTISRLTPSFRAFEEAVSNVGTLSDHESRE